MEGGGEGGGDIEYYGNDEAHVLALIGGWPMSSRPLSKQQIIKHICLPTE